MSKQAQREVRAPTQRNAVAPGPLVDIQYRYRYPGRALYYDSALITYLAIKDPSMASIRVEFYSSTIISVLYGSLYHFLASFHDVPAAAKTLF